jgi:hypothetical protein
MTLDQLVHNINSGTYAALDAIVQTVTDETFLLCAVPVAMGLIIAFGWMKELEEQRDAKAREERGRQS